MKALLVIALSSIFLGCSSQNDDFMQGRWCGKIESINNTAELILDYNDGKALLSIAEQGLLKYPVSELNISSNIIKFKLMLGKTIIQFEGKRIIDKNNDTEYIKGIYLQNGVTRHFELNHIGNTPIEKPYNNMIDEGKDETILLNRNKIVLSSRLRMPYKDSHQWAALIIPGSGPTDGDGNSKLLPAPNNSLLRLSNVLAKNGIPSLRIDKRGTGYSNNIGEEEIQDFTTFIEDSKAWLKKLKEYYPNRKIAIIGNSQGSLIAMIVANLEGCDALISISGSGVPIDETLNSQTSNFNEELREKASNIISQLKDGKTVNDVPISLNMLFRKTVQPFLISYMKYDPRKEIEKASYPIMIIQGEQDTQTTIKDALELKAHAENAEIVILPLMNHLLRDVNNLMENKASYCEDRLPLSNDLEKKLMDFLNKTFHKNKNQ